MAEGKFRGTLAPGMFTQWDHICAKHRSGSGIIGSLQPVFLAWMSTILRQLYFFCQCDNRPIIFWNVIKEFVVGSLIPFLQHLYNYYQVNQTRFWPGLPWPRSDPEVQSASTIEELHSIRYAILDQFRLSSATDSFDKYLSSRVAS